MRFVVFQCIKCEHNLYIENTDELFKKLGKVSNMDCPRCGEYDEGNWRLAGLRNEFPYTEVE